MISLQTRAAMQKAALAPLANGLVRNQMAGFAKLSQLNLWNNGRHP